MKLFQTMTGMMAGVAVLAISSLASAQSSKASHVDFDDQLIQGQVNKGAVHLIERKDSDLGSLVKVRKSYRKEILAGSENEPSIAPSTMVAAIPASGLPTVKATEIDAPAPAPIPKAATKVAPAAPVAAKQAAAKKNDSKSKGQAVKTTIGGSRAISRR